MGKVRSSVDNSLLATYWWLADGRKSSVTDSAGQGFHYLGSLVYKPTGASGPGAVELESAAFGGGRINKTSNGYEVSYFVTDHLGSTRATVNGTGTVTSRNNYLPFGLQWSDPGAPVSTNRWLYNGKELQTTGFADIAGIFDFGWRMNDSRIVRWKNLDKFSDKFYPWSPYNYTLNNPIRFIDPDGRLTTDFYNLKGILVKHVNDGLQDKVLVNTNSNKVEKADEAISKGETAPVISNAAVRALDSSIARTEATGNEHGFRVGNAGTVSRVVEGSPGEINAAQWAPAVSDLTSQGDRVAYDAHTHPPIAPDGRMGNPKASDTDIANTVGSKPNIVIGYRADNEIKPATQIVGTPAIKYTPQIRFFDNTGSLGVPIDYSKYRNAVLKINGK